MPGLIAPDGKARGRVSHFATEIAAQAAAASITTPAPAVWRAEPPGGGAAGTLDRGLGAPASTPGPAGARGRLGAPRRRRLGALAPAVVIIILMVLIATGLGFEFVTGIPVLPSGLTAAVKPPPRQFPVLDPSEPVELAIPSVGLAAPVHQVGLAADGTIAVPPPERAQEAGWYDQSPTPGQYGPAVIVGHVDTRTGPAVFHELNKVRPGAKVDVTRQNGSVAVFEVNSVRRFDKTRLPADQVYDDFSRPGLRLITCGGRWVGGTTGYADNVVVFASLVSARTP